MFVDKVLCLLNTVVTSTVINQNTLQIRIRLVNNRLKASFDIGRDIIDWNNDADFHVLWAKMFLIRIVNIRIPLVQYKRIT